MTHHRHCQVTLVEETVNLLQCLASRFGHEEKAPETGNQRQAAYQEE